jgi:tetratricopeptide (TPR) repeat protein
MYRLQGRYDEAVPCYKRSLEILQNKLGPDHPDVALALSNLADLLQKQRRYGDAELLYEQALKIVRCRSS